MLGEGTVSKGPEVGEDLPERREVAAVAEEQAAGTGQVGGGQVRTEVGKGVESFNSKCEEMLPLKGSLSGGTSRVTVKRKLGLHLWVGRVGQWVAQMVCSPKGWVRWPQGGGVSEVPQLGVSGLGGAGVEGTGFGRSHTDGPPR